MCVFVCIHRVQVTYNIDHAITRFRRRHSSTFADRRRRERARDHSRRAPVDKSNVSQAILESDRIVCVCEGSFACLTHIRHRP